MKNITTQFLNKTNACSDAVAWGKEQNLIGKPARPVLNALIKADKLEWANWLIVRVLPYKGYVSYAVYDAELVIDIYEKKYPNDKRPREAIEVAKTCIKNPTAKNKNAANAAAYSADAAYSTADATRKEMKLKILKYGLTLLT